MNYEMENISAGDLPDNEKETMLKEVTDNYNKKKTANRDNLVLLIKTAAKKKGVQDLRKELEDSATEDEEISHSDLFNTFCNNCLVFMVKRKDWKANRTNSVISKFITVPDEAMGMLALENIAPDLIEFINNQTMIHPTSTPPSANKKSSKAKYTSRKGRSFGTIRGWHNSGIARYNELCEVVRKHRKSATSTKLESDLLKEYKQEEHMNQQSDDDEVDGDSNASVHAILPFDGFA